VHIFYAWKLVAIQSNIPGIESINVKLGKTYPPTGQDNLSFASHERAWIDISMIDVVKR